MARKKAAGAFKDNDSLSGDHPIFISPIIIESGQPARRRGQAIKDTEVGRFNNARGYFIEDGREERNYTHKNEKEIVLSDTETQPSATSPAINTKAIAVPPVTQTPRALIPYLIPYRAKQPLRELHRSHLRLAIEQTSGKKADTQSKGKTKKRPLSIDSDSESGNNGKSRRSRWKTKGRMTMAEAMLEGAKIYDSRERERSKADREERRQRFELEREQRDRHHAVEMARLQVLLHQSSERLKLAQLELKLQQQRGYGAFGSSNHDSFK